jgi:hypothetical protein
MNWIPRPSGIATAEKRTQVHEDGASTIARELESVADSLDPSNEHEQDDGEVDGHHRLETVGALPLGPDPDVFEEPQVEREPDDQDGEEVEEAGPLSTAAEVQKDRRKSHVEDQAQERVVVERPCSHDVDTIGNEKRRSPEAAGGFSVGGRSPKKK